MSRSRGWCFTLNNNSEDDNLELQKMQDDEVYRYLVFGRETGEEGTPHLQGYVFFSTMKSFKQVKQMLSRAHWEAQRGSCEQAIDYCKKDGDFFEDGEAPLSKKQKGDKGKEFWDDVKAKAMSGSIEEIDSKVFVTHFGALTRIAARYAPMPPDAEEVTGEWYYGLTHTGKSYTARTTYPNHYLKLCNKWWDGYNGEEVAIIEDFDKQHAVLGYHLKIWADRYAFPAEVKGGKVNIRPKRIVVTSNYSPSEIWSDSQTLDPILRRFKIKQFH